MDQRIIKLFISFLKDFWMDFTFDLNTVSFYGFLAAWSFHRDIIRDLDTFGRFRITSQNSSLTSFYLPGLSSHCFDLVDLNIKVRWFNRVPTYSMDFYFRYSTHKLFAIKLRFFKWHQWLLQTHLMQNLYRTFFFQAFNSCYCLLFEIVTGRGMSY